jgi:hypothetical protein
MPRLRAERRAAERPVPTPIEERVEAWRAAGLVAKAPPAREAAGDDVARGRAALAADSPEETRRALALFREALAVDPQRLDAVAGFAEAVADRADGDPDADAEELRVAHELVQHARGIAPDRPDVLAAYARLLLAVPSAANDAEAFAMAEQAYRLAPAEAPARLALGLAQSRRDPLAAARLLEESAGFDRRLLSAAARARWAAGDAVGALALADRRLALDPGHGGALALRAEIEGAAGRLDAARATLARWESAEPRSPLPPLLLARLAYQDQGDHVLARRLLDAALARDPGEFVAARILSHRAAVARAAGDRAAAMRDVAEAVRRVPGSAPARFQEALLAYERDDARALRNAAGVLDARAGPVAQALLAARTAELSGTLDEAQEAYAAVVAAASHDPAVLLGASGALARLRAPGTALDLARRALARDPLEGRVHRAPTEFWEGGAPLAEAARRLAAIAARESRGSSVALAAAAEAEVLLGRTVDAERLARAASRAAPQDSAPLVVLAQISLDRGRPDAALPLARAATASGGAPARAVLARTVEALGRAADAERLWRETLDLAPDLVTGRLALAGLLARRGAVDEARALLEGLLAEDPGLAPARGALLALAPSGKRAATR